MSHGAAVAAGHPDTVAAAAEVLAAGGNAFDAVVAAGFAAAIAEPGLTSLGGGGFLLAHQASGEEHIVDFFVDTPGVDLPPTDAEPHFRPITIRFTDAEQVFHAGYAAVAVPGCLDGYLHVHRSLGRLALASVVEPARRLASDGVIINEQQAEFIELLEGIFTLTAEGRSLFAPGDRLLRTGDRFVNQPLADLLTDLASGTIDGIASPAIAKPLADAMATQGGLVTPTDLAAYRVVERDPLVARLGDVRLATNPPPSFGGTLVVRALEMLEELGAFTPGTLTDDEVSLRVVDALTTITEHHAGPRSAKGTTHVSIADAEGNVASMTTSNGSCSGVFIPGTGVQLNNIMGEEDLHPDGLHSSPPGLRVGSMMAPTLLDDPSGRCVALGSGGSERIRSAITQVITHVLRGADLVDAVEAPRLHWDGTAVQVEPGIPARVLAELRRTRTVNEWPRKSLYFGGAHAVTTEGAAAGDPRRGGSTIEIP